MELGFSGPGAGMTDRLFDAALDLGVNFGRQELLGVQAGLNQTTRLGLNSTALPPATGQPFGIDQRTLMIGLALLIGAVVLAKL